MSNTDAEGLDPQLTALLRAPSAPMADPERTQGEDLFRALLLHLRQVLWMRDSDRGILYVSPAYEHIWGRTCQSLYDNPDTFVSSIHLEDRERMVATLTNQQEAAGYDEEYRILRPDGEMRWIWARSYPVRAEQGRPTLFAGIAEDVTERKAAEKERSRLVAIIEYSDDVIVTISLDGIVLGWNQGAERHYGYAAEEMIGQSILVLFPADRYQEYVQILKTVRCGEPMPAYDTVRQRKDGTLINVSLSISPIEARRGEVLGASTIARDITRVKALEGQLREAQKMDVIGQLAGGIAHDFNNLLTAILGYTELLLPDFKPEHPHYRDLDQIRLSATRASHLTGQLLAFSRRQVLQLTVVDLNALVTNTATLLRRLIGEDIELTLSLDGALGRLKVDPGQIDQVLMNLAINARDAMPRGGRLTIETMNVEVDDQFFRRHGMASPGGAQGFVALVVGDTGTGMDRETQKHIFEPFFTTKPKGRGTGLGLSTVYGIVTQSKGSIWVYSEPGQGTTFKVYLPRTDENLAPEVLPVAAAASTDGTETILLVEDDGSVRLLTCDLLTRRGYRVIEAVDAEQAITLAAAEPGPIDLLLTDVVLPGQSGPELVEHFARIRPQMKVLYFSGYTDDAFVRRGVLTADVPFLQKPFTALGLTRRVRDVLDAGAEST